MVLKSPSSMLFAGGNTECWTRMRSVFLLLVLVGTAPGTLLAQEPPSDPVEHFHSLLAQGSSVDQARDRTARYFGPAVGAEIAVYTCSPDPAPVCRGSEVYAAWGDFLELIREYEYRVDMAVEAMVEQYDAYLASSIAVNWCSPEPKYGCANSPYYKAWAIYVNRVSVDGNPAAAVAAVASVYPELAQHIGAFVCAEPTCYAAEMALLDTDELAQRPSISSQSSSDKQGSSGYKFASQSGNTDSYWRSWFQKAQDLRKRRQANPDN